MPTPRQRSSPRLAPGRNGIDASFEKTSFALLRSSSPTASRLTAPAIEQCPYSRCQKATHRPPAGPVTRDNTKEDFSRTAQSASTSPHSHPMAGNGGARRDRTDDLMLAKHALSQLSYGPITEDDQNCKEARTFRSTLPKEASKEPDRMVVGLGRLERPTSPLSGVRSNRLSYRPETGAPP